MEFNTSLCSWNVHCCVCVWVFTTIEENLYEIEMLENWVSYKEKRIKNALY